MSGFFGVVSKKDCVFDLFFGTDYHSHLGTRRGGLAVYGNGAFNRAIHNIENSPFRTKFERDFEEMKGNAGIGCISDNEPQPLLVRSHLGNFAIVTVGRINNIEQLVKQAFAEGATHFLEMSGGSINATELTAALINRKATIAEGIRYAQSVIEGSMSILILVPEGIYAARDKMGRTPGRARKKGERALRRVRIFLLSQSRLYARSRTRPRRDRLSHGGGRRGHRPALRHHEDLYFLMGLLRLSRLFLRGAERGKNAL